MLPLMKMRDPSPMNRDAYFEMALRQRSTSISAGVFKASAFSLETAPIAPYGDHGDLEHFCQLFDGDLTGLLYGSQDVGLPFHNGFF